MKKILPKDQQPTNDQKAKAHIIADQKKISRRAYRQIASVVTGADSTLKMTPIEADRFIRALERVPGKPDRQRMKRYGIPA